jgi:hypothetical protein
MISPERQSAPADAPGRTTGRAWAALKAGIIPLSALSQLAEKID